MLFDIRQLDFIFGWPSFIVSLLTVGWWSAGSRTTRLLKPNKQDSGSNTSLAHSMIPAPGSLAWPIGISLLPGQIGGLLVTLGYVGLDSLPMVIASLWTIAAFASTARYAQKTFQRCSAPDTLYPDTLYRDSLSPNAMHRDTSQPDSSPPDSSPPDSSHPDAWHALLAASAAFVLSWIYYTGPGTNGLAGILSWTAIISLFIGGVWVVVVHHAKNAGRGLSLASTATGFLVPIIGAVFLSQTVASQLSTHWILCVAIGWMAAWLVMWRTTCPDSDTKVTSLPDVGLLAVIVGILAGLCFDVWDSNSIVGFAITWPADLLIAGSVLSLVVTTSRRINRQFSTETLVALIVLAACLAGMKTGVAWTVPTTTLLACGLLGSSLAVATGASMMNLIVSTLTKPGATNITAQQKLIRASWIAAVAIVAASIAYSIFQDIAGDRLAAHLSIAAIAVVTLGLSELSERAWKVWKSCEQRLRVSTVIAGLTMVILIAITESFDERYPLLTIVMRVLVAMMVAAPTLLFVLPTLLGKTISARWLKSFRRGAVAALAIAAGSTLAMLGLEFSYRVPDVGIDDLPLPLVLMVGTVLAAFSVLSAIIAVTTGPRGMLKDRLGLTDGGRLVAIYAAQGFAAVTWLHKYLCLDELAFIGLRAHWPYIVMVLAFLSVGLTQWATNRKDAVLAEQLKRTALFLPIVPLVGFWLSAWVNKESGSDLSNWVFGGGRVPYEWMLVLAAIYYFATSVLWKRKTPRITGIMLGNAALWVWLIQIPGWGFLTHPQAWLIPPAACVLALTHFSHKNLGKSTATAIRSAATLVIYISSTADMLIADIGTTIAGPIVLITLALAGMLAGVILRVRSFLFLGLTFVLIGLLSMVWHAQQAIDAVWPWWVFGISTGILILISLAMLEKNKPKLQQYASQLAAWDG